MQKIRWAILLTGVIVLLAAVLQNSENVLLKLFFFETQLPVSVLMLVTATISFLVGGFTIGRMMRRSAKAVSKPITKPATKPDESVSPRRPVVLGGSPDDGKTA